jgi:hypothetical protein
VGCAAPRAAPRKFMWSFQFLSRIYRHVMGKSDRINYSPKRAVRLNAESRAANTAEGDRKIKLSVSISALVTKGHGRGRFETLEG